MLKTEKNFNRLQRSIKICESSSLNIDPYKGEKNKGYPNLILPFNEHSVTSLRSIVDGLERHVSPI